VGRDEALSFLEASLVSGALVSVVGPAGVGKTRLALQLGRALPERFPGGIFFCDLSEARSLEGICFAAAGALEVTLGPQDPVVQLGHAIDGRGRCLVVLDNFEQVVELAAVTLGRWRERAEAAAFAVTSRERLGLAGEQTLPLEPLEEGPAVALFVARARAQRPSFSLGAHNRADVEALVALLDGLPLAIELAAGRARMMSPGKMVERMGQRGRRGRLRLLHGGPRGGPARQATLRAAIDWSPATPSGSCSRPGSRRRWPGAACSKAASRWRPPRPCSTESARARRAGRWTSCSLWSTRACCASRGAKERSRGWGCT